MCARTGLLCLGPSVTRVALLCLARFARRAKKKRETARSLRKTVQYKENDINSPSK